MRTDLHMPLRFDGFVFADPGIEAAARTVVFEYHGREAGMERSRNYASRKLFSLLSGFTRETLSFSSLKEEIGRRAFPCICGRLLLLFLERYKDLYAGDDAKEAREVVTLLSQMRDGFGHFNEPGVNSYRNIVAYSYYKRSVYFFLKTDDRLLLTLLRDFFLRSPWQHATFPRQWLVDLFVSSLEEASVRRGVRSAADIDQEFFFDIVDAALAQPRGKNELLTMLMGFFKHGVTSLGFSLDEGPYFNREAFLSTQMARFLRHEYTGRVNTFLLIKRDIGFKHTIVNVSLPVPSLRPVFERLFTGRGLSSYEYRSVQGQIISSLEGYVTDWSSFTFTEECFFHQVGYFRMVYAGSERDFGFAVAALRALYVSVDAVNGGAFFRDARFLTYGVLTTPRFIEYITADYIFTLYSPYETVDSGLRRVFILKGFDSYKKTLLREDYIGIDFSAITDPFYRSLAWRCVTSDAKRLYRLGLHSKLRQTLVYLDMCKSMERYRTPSHGVFSVWDALMVNEFFEDICSTPATFNSSITDVRDFLRWASGCRCLDVDPVAFDVLKKKKMPKNVTNTPVIPDEAITALSGWLAERSRQESKYAQALIIFNLLIITPMRSGHVCKLRRDELVFDSFLNSYVYMGISKGTNGGKDAIVLGGGATGLIRKALAIGEEIGKDCPDPGMRDYVFVCRERQHYDVFSTVRFRKLFERANAACGYDFGPANIRATYMTKAYIEASRSGRSDRFLLKLFAYHRSSGTTLDHYVNHDEALSALTDFLKTGNSWDKIIYPDEVAALNAVIEETRTLIEEAPDEDTRHRLSMELKDYERQLARFTS